MFRHIEYNSVLYAQCLWLREQVLRKPLGLVLSPADLAGEAQQWHLALVEQDTLLACLVIKPEGGGSVKLRQMAVTPAMQGCGLGRHLVEAAERWLMAQGIALVELDARVTAIGFYHALGY